MKKITAILMLLIFNSLTKAQPDWTLMPSGTTKDINAIWGSSPYNVYAVGEDGLILHYDGIVWKNISTSITDDLVDIIGFSASEIYILSSDTLYERVGNTWGVFAASPSFFYGNTIWGTSGTSLFVGGGMPSGGSSGIYYYNGTQWQTQVSGFSTINDIYGSAAGDIYAGGNHEGSGGKTHHYKNCTGSNLWWPTVLSSEEVTGVWAINTDNAFASTKDGRVYGYTGQLQNGICWMEIWNVILDLGFGAAKLQGIWGFPDGIYTFGSKNRLPIGTTTSLIYHFDGQSWNEMTTQTDSTNFRTVYSVWGLDTTNVFAVGENGLILRLHGEIYDTLVVNKTSDEPDINPGDGLCNTGGALINGRTPCTLRAAIMESNETDIENIITFEIPGTLPQTITPSSALPTIIQKVIIQAPRIYTEGSSIPGIQLNGINAGSGANGLTLKEGGGFTISSFNKISNLAIYNFKGDGIYIETSYNIINGCYIGTDLNSSPNTGNHRNGIYIFDGDYNEIGKEGESGRNIISGNKENGIKIKSSSNQNIDRNKVVNNFIGTKGNGLESLGNQLSGIFIDASDRSIIGGNNENSGNLISGNLLYGINLTGNDSKISGNIIGLNINGDSLYNPQQGMLITSSRNILGGSEPFERNILSGNSIGIEIKYGDENKILGNFVGVNKSGNSIRKNDIGIKIGNHSSRNIIGSDISNQNVMNIISGNNIGIQILEGINNIINFNSIGSNFNNDALGNKIGIQVIGGFLNKIGKVENYNNWNNFIHFNETGIQIESSVGQANQNITIDHCAFNGNKTGIRTLAAENVSIIRNQFTSNDTAIVGYNSELFAKQNYIYNSQSPNSSIHLNNSYADIKNNLITLDAGDAIKLENGSTADINYNNIFDNSGFGLNNTTPSIITNAQSNWWGDASGPGGQGPGNGDPVSSGVDYLNWLTELLAVTITASSDTVFTPVGNSDSAFIYVGNWLNPDDVLDINLSDNLNWLQGPLNYSVNLDSVFGVSSKILFQIPGSVTAGTRNLVQVTAVSQSNPSHSQTDTFYIEAYQPVVSAIYITPDTINLSPGDSIQFLTSGYDQYNKVIDFNTQWNATGGTINNDGWFYAGTQQGTFEVTATDPSSQVQGTATVIISITVDVKDKLTEIPTEYNLYQNYPNPFNPATTIRYAIPFASTVTMTIYNILGEQIEKLINEEKNPGTYEINWNASKLASGVYIYLLKAESIESNKIYRNAKKLILLK